MADRMRQLLAPFILRRLKSEVAGQLVPKKQLLMEVRPLSCQGLGPGPRRGVEAGTPG